ncbi:hypothetical protein LCGC14_2814440, partial [marine sediment metagenome]
VDALGSISDAVLGTLILNSGAAANSAVGGFALVAGDVVAAAYMTGTDVVVATFTCDSSGNIGAVIDTINLALDPGNTLHMPDIEKVTGNVFAVSYSDGSVDGWMKTITINDDGSIDEPELDSLEWQTSQGTKPYILQVSAARYLQIAAHAAQNRGYIWQVNITDAGIISLVGGVGYGAFDSYEYIGGVVLPVSGDVYVIFYHGGPSNNAMVATVTCDFVDAPTLINTWELFSGATSWPRAVEVSQNQAGNGKVFAVMISADGADTDQLKTIEVLNDGTITESILDSQQIEARLAYNPDILRHAPGIYLISARALTAPAKQTVYTVDIEEAVVARVGGIARRLVSEAFM